MNVDLARKKGDIVLLAHLKHQQPVHQQRVNFLINTHILLFVKTCLFIVSDTGIIAKVGFRNSIFDS